MRPRFLSLLRTTVHGACSVWVLPEHRLLSGGVVVPAIQRRQVHRAQLPLTNRIDPPDRESRDLLAARHREPQLDQRRSGPREHRFELGDLTEELVVLVIGAKAHHPLDPGAVVPGSIEQDDLALRRQVPHVPLEVPLAPLALARHRQCNHVGATWIEVLHEPLDRATLSGRVTSLEQDNQLLTRLADPCLRLEQLDLQETLRDLVLIALHALVVRVSLAPGLDRQTIRTDQDRVVDLIPCVRRRQAVRHELLGRQVLEGVDDVGQIDDRLQVDKPLLHGSPCTVGSTRAAPWRRLRDRDLDDDTASSWVARTELGRRAASTSWTRRH